VIDVNANLPRHLGRIIKRALEKDVNRCFQTALDLRNELEDLHGEIESGEVLTTGATVPVMGAGARKGSRALPIAIGALVVAAIAIAWMILGQGPAGSEGPGLRVTTHGIAVSSGFEYSPTIAPDGQWIVFATIPEGPPPEGFPPGIQGAPDLFLQNIDGQTRINLTNTPLTMEVFPQYSPDGSQIVYVRDGPDGSGIYVMGATGENPRLLTRGNANPAWAPDGTKIYVAERGFQDPRSVSGASDIRVIDVGSGEETMLFGNNGWTAMQPSASPNGERVAFWALSPAGGQRDLYTIPAGGGDPVALTNDRALDWSPLWSPDGKHLYFSSDRGGSMNIWRVAVDEATGEALGEPEPLTSGGLGDQGLLSISADGSRLVYMDSLLRSHAMRAGFDADSLTVADDGVQLSGPVRVTNLHPSPDGQRLAYVSFGSRQDLWVVNIDGTDERQLTDDIDKDWNPRWLNDNETLIFRSDRGGAYDVWRMRSDGSGRTKIVVTEETEMNLAPSPDGRYVTATQRDVDYTPLFEIGDDPQSPGVTRLPSIPETGGFLIPSDWSPDGNWLAGSWEGIVLYHRETGEYRRLTDRGAEPRFTPDGTRIMYSIPIGPFFEWWIIDLETLEQRQITVPDPTVNDLWLLPDGEHVVYQMTREPEFNVWMLEIAEGAGR
jgi:Tol biopolymer transport system component